MLVSSKVRCNKQREKKRDLELFLITGETRSPRVGVNAPFMCARARPNAGAGLTFLFSSNVGVSFSLPRPRFSPAALYFFYFRAYNTSLQIHVCVIKGGSHTYSLCRKQTNAVCYI